MTITGGEPTHDDLTGAQPVPHPPFAGDAAPPAPGSPSRSANEPPFAAPSFPGAPPHVPPIARQRRGVPLPFAIGGGIAAILVSCFAGVGIGTAGSDGTSVKTTSATPAPGTRTVTETVTASAAPAPAASTVTVTAAPPAGAAPPAAGRTTIEEGTYSVGVDIQPGTYRTVGAGSDCYWSITKSGSNGSDIVDNHIGAGNLTVTLKAGQDFTSQRCGTWSRTG